MIQNAVELVKNLRSYPEEVEHVEFKRNFSEAKKEAEDISALANSAAYHGVPAAYKVWGIDDATHDVIGTTFNPRSKKVGNQPLELWLRQHLSDNADFEFEVFDCDGKQLVVLKILPATSYPVTYDYHAFIRTDSSTHALRNGSAQESALWRKIQQSSFESQVALEDASLDEALALIDYSQYFELLDIPQPASCDSIAHYLVKDDLLVEQDDGRYGITNLGALLFAKDLSAFPSVRRKKLRIARYQGKSRIDERIEREFSEGYAVMLGTAYSYIDGLVAAGDVLEGVRRESRRAYSEVSLRELVVNALIHQDFSVTGTGPVVEVFDDRIEITNPGEPLVDIDRIVNDPPRSRNEMLSALMRRFGYCEEAGSGWDKIMRGSEVYRSPCPLIEIKAASSMRVTLFQPRDFKNLTLEERLQACYWHACVAYEARSYITNATLRERFGVSGSNSAQISRLIKQAVESELIKPVDPDASPKYMRYQPSWV